MVVLELSAHPASSRLSMKLKSLMISESPWINFNFKDFNFMFKHVQVIDSWFSPRHRQGSHSASCSKSLHRTDNDPQSKGAKGCLERCFMAELLCSSWCLFITGYESCLSKCHSWWNWNIPKDLHLLHHSSHFMKHNRISMNFYLLPQKILPQKSQPNQSASKARHRIVRGFVPRHPTHHGGVKAMAHPGPTTRSSKWPQCIWIATFSWEQNGTKTMGDLIEMY